ncbi:MAG: D-aminoacyl-tRNA deacylase, partial [Candidatus Hadarchaeales archaeon]
MKLVIASRDDPAAMNIASHVEDLIRSRGEHNLRLARVSGDVTKLSGLPEEADEVIVASRHVAESGRRSLTVHVPGNPEEGIFAVASPCTVWKALRALARAREELELPHTVSLEATHHGPCDLEVPVTFVEIGSIAEHWLDRRAGEAVALAIIEAAADGKILRNAVGFGGPHYAPRHTDVALKTDVAPGHIFPGYSNFNRAAIEAAVNRTAGGVE